MIRYLNSPLKIFGTILTLAGAALVVLLSKQMLLVGLSLLSMGLMVYFTEWLMEMLSVKKSQKRVYEYFLLTLVFCFLLAIALDYLGVIRMQSFL